MALPAELVRPLARYAGQARRDEVEAARHHLASAGDVDPDPDGSQARGPRPASLGRPTGAAGSQLPAPAPPAAEPDLAVDLGRGLVLANPILVASGTFGYGIEYGDVVDDPAARRDLLQGHDAEAADRQPHAPRDRDARRHAQLDRPPEPGRRRGHREVRRHVDRLEGAGDRERRRRVGRGLRRGRAPARRRARRRRHRAEHQLPERRQGRAPVRDRRGGRRRGHRRRPPGDGPAAAREARRRTSPTSDRSRRRSRTPAPTR